MSGLGLHELSIGYTQPLCAPITLSVATGEIVAVLGASGSGKSTLLRTIAGVQRPLAGTVTVDDVDITDRAIHERGVGLVFQEPLLFTHLDAVDNVAYGMRRHGMTKSEARTQAGELLAWVGLQGLEKRSVLQLSGGQAQRVALARALAPQPQVMLLDEPFSALDVDLRTRLVHEVAALLRERGCATLYVTHDPDEAAVMADRVVRI